MIQLLINCCSCAEAVSIDASPLASQAGGDQGPQFLEADLPLEDPETWETLQLGLTSATPPGSRGQGMSLSNHIYLRKVPKIHQNDAPKFHGLFPFPSTKL